MAHDGTPWPELHHELALMDRRTACDEPQAAAVGADRTVSRSDLRPDALRATWQASSGASGNEVNSWERDEGDVAGRSAITKRGTADGAGESIETSR